MEQSTQLTGGQRTHKAQKSQSQQIRLNQTKSPRTALVFTNSNNFRLRLVTSLLTSRPVSITGIRSSSNLQVGLLPYELSFLKLVLELSNGSSIKISETGTSLKFVPGIPTGGCVEFETDCSRPLSYYLEPILLLAPFCKKNIELKLKGRLQNSSQGYTSIYKIKYSALPITQKFGLRAEIEVLSRSQELSTILFKCSIRRQLQTLRGQYSQLPGPVKSIRGLAYGFRVTPQLLNRLCTSSKGIFVNYISDVSITTDLVKRSKSQSPGYGIVLYAETTRGVIYCKDGWVGRGDAQNGDSNANETNTPAGNTVVSKTLEDYNKESGGRNLISNYKKRFNIFNEEDEDGGIDDEKGPAAKRQKNLKSVSTTETTSTSNGAPESPEDLSQQVSALLLQEIKTKSCIDSCYQYLVLGLMAFSGRDVASVVMDKPTPFTVLFMRDLKVFMGTVYRVEEFDNGPNDESSEDGEKETKSNLYKYSCLGSGYINLNKTMI